MGHRAAEDEAPRLDARDEIELFVLERLRNAVDRQPQTFRVLQKRRDVPEHDAGLGVIRDGSDQGFEFFCDGHEYLLAGGVGKPADHAKAAWQIKAFSLGPELKRAPQGPFKRSELPALSAPRRSRPSFW